MQVHTWKLIISQNPSKSVHVVSFSPRLNSQLSTSPSNCSNLSARSSLVWPVVVRIRSLANSNKETKKVHLGIIHHCILDLNMYLKGLEFGYCLNYVHLLQTCNTILTEQTYPLNSSELASFKMLIFKSLRWALVSHFHSPKHERLFYIKT